MRSAVIALFGASLFLLLGCGKATGVGNGLLCTSCTVDTDCAGAPCFADVSGGRFCGIACDGGCPAGYSCQPVSGANGSVADTCFPDTEVCQNPHAPDLSASMDPTPDGGAPPNHDDLGTLPVGGTVGPKGGTVDRLFFGFSGDTRPAQCGGKYPTPIINNIFDGMKAQGAQFALDQGDHMFNCGSGASAFSGAKQQIGEYLTAANRFGKTVFMTMGNHECSGSSSALCSTGSSYGSNPNYTAFLDALAPVSPTPYYRFDVQTKTGLAVFIVIADDAWDATQKAWLETQLTDADAHAKYTFVSKHHPDGNTDQPAFQGIYDQVRKHKYTLFLTGHSHLFKRQSSDPRAMVIGCGGAPLAGGTFWGYGTALQGSDDRIYVRIYDQSTGNTVDSFSVGPQ